MALFALLLLSQTVTAQQAETRIIEQPTVVVSLVGQPCDDAVVKLMATLPLELCLISYGAAIRTTARS